MTLCEIYARGGTTASWSSRPGKAKGPCLVRGGAPVHTPIQLDASCRHVVMNQFGIAVGVPVMRLGRIEPRRPPPAQQPAH